MPAAWITAGAGLLGALSGGQAQGGTTTQSKDPWIEAQPWMKQNLQTGQDLQSYYQQNPFNSQQQNAYRNLSAGTNYINQITPGLLQQMSRQQGFDRNNPQARPQTFNFAPPSGGGMQNLGYGSPMGMSSGQSQNPYASGGAIDMQMQMRQMEAARAAAQRPAPREDYSTGFPDIGA